jgi:signal transduction histidine kinase
MQSPSADLEPARERTNIGLEEERADTDLALRHDRGRREERLVVNQRLTDERAETDALLLNERVETDAVVDDVTLHLVDEQAAHALARTAVARRDELLALVSHELRSPLTAIALNAEALLGASPVASLDGGEIRTIAEDVRAACGQMTLLVGDLLDLASMEAGRLKVTLEDEDAAALVRDAVSANRPMIHMASLSLVVDCPTEPLRARLDRRRLLQVLANLFANAVKFTRPGGTITVSLASGEQGLRFCVADTGSGIPPEHASRVFDRFWQLGGSDRRGVGLGLYICKAIVEAHGGRIWVHSEPGVGSQLYFTIPIGPLPVTRAAG